MNKIHIFGGEAGGLGKSTVCSAAIAYHQTHKIDCLIFDTDRSKPDIYRAHKDLGCRRAILSEAERLENGANVLFEAAVSEQKPVLVNLPAASFLAFADWFSKSDLLMLAEEFDVAFYHWFVLDGTPTTNKLLIRSLQHFKGTIHHIAVKNHGKSNEWGYFNDDQTLQSLLKHYDVPVIDFPRFHGEVERQTIADQRLSLLAASEYQDFGIISRQRVKKFIRESGEAFEKLDVFG